MSYQFDVIVGALDQHQQRATYSAVAALLGETPRSLMRGRPRAPGNSWIVSKTTGKPTGYADTDLHPRLTANERVIKTREELAAWLSDVGLSEEAARQ